MDAKDVAIAALRSLSLAAEMLGAKRLATYADSVASLIESDQDVEEHMRLINQKLMAREITDEDWADAESRIRADLARLNEP